MDANDQTAATQTEQIKFDLDSVIRCAQEHGQMTAAMTILDEFYHHPPEVAEAGQAIDVIQIALRAAGWIT